MESPVKEEKLEIKRGILKKSPGEDMSIFKRWKSRYFVFCEIKKGESRSLKLYYYESKATFMEGKLPLNFIDITTANHIAMMDREVSGHNHIIQISTPGRTYYLSASSCDDMFNWILPLRSYKFNDESQIPWYQLCRSNTWNGAAAARERAESSWSAPPDLQVSPYDKRRISMDPACTSMDNFKMLLSNEKLRRNFLFCSKCQAKKDEFIPSERYQWVRRSATSPNDYIRPPRAQAVNDTIYEEVPACKGWGPLNSTPNSSQENYENVRAAMPLPGSLTGTYQTPSSRPVEKEENRYSSDNDSVHSGGSEERRRGSKERRRGSEERRRGSEERPNLQTVPSIYVEKQKCNPDMLPSNATKFNLNAIDSGYIVMQSVKNVPIQNSNKEKYQSMSLPKRNNLNKIEKTLSVPHNLNRLRVTPQDVYSSTNSLSPSFNPGLSRIPNNYQNALDLEENTFVTDTGIRMEQRPAAFDTTSMPQPVDFEQRTGRKRATENDNNDSSAVVLPPMAANASKTEIDSSGSSSRSCHENNERMVLRNQFIQKFDNMKFEFVTDV